MPHLTYLPGDPWSIETLYDEMDEPRRLANEQLIRERSNEWRTTDYGNYNKSIYVSLDPGKKQDYSALVFLEPFLPLNPEEDQDKFIYHLSRIERLPLETPYPKVARLLRKVYNQLLKSPDYDYIYIIIDEGGVGTAVADQIVELIPNADIYRVTLTGGIRPRWIDARNVSLPKQQMASTLISLFEGRRLWVANEMKRQVEELKDELLNFEHKITQTGYDQYAAMKIGTHDDITCAIGNAAFIAEDMGGGSVPLIW